MRYYANILEVRVTKDEKLSEVVRNFSVLPEEKQNHVLGILQALVFACYEQEKPAYDEALHEAMDEN